MAPNRKNLASVLQALSNSDLETLQDSVKQQQPKFLPLTDPACEESKDHYHHQKHQDDAQQQQLHQQQHDVVKPASSSQQCKTAAASNSSTDASYWDWPADTDASSSTEATASTDTNHPSSPVSADADTAGTATATISNTDYWLEDNTNTCNEETDVDVAYYIDYSSRGQLGKGTKTTVRKALERKNGKKYAVKSIRKVYNTETNAMQREATILRQLDHPNIIKYHDVVQNSKSFHLLLELCSGQELYQKVAQLASNNQGTMSEEEAIMYVEQLVQAIAYCHCQGIVHRDLKLENIVHYYKNNTTTTTTTKNNRSNNKLKKMKKNTEIRLLDFGLATRLHHPNQQLTEKVGSPQYVAPEVLNQNYNEKCDIWSIGIISYALLCAEAPFVGTTNKETYEKIQNSPVTFHQSAWNKVSNEAKDFIRCCLNKDPKVRPSALQLLGHEWLNNQKPPQQPQIAATKKKQQFKLLSKVFNRGGGGGAAAAAAAGKVKQ